MTGYLSLKLTRREMVILRNIVEDHRDSEIESEANHGRKTADSILSKINVSISKASKT